MTLTLFAQLTSYYYFGAYNMKKQPPPKPKSSHLRFWNNIKLQYLVLIILSFILYGRCLQYDYDYLDDTLLVVDNFNFNNDFSNIPQAFSQHIFKIQNHPDRSHDYYRPLMTVSFMIDAHLSDSSAPMLYHFTNILLHTLAVILLLLFLRKLGVGEIPAFFLSLFFLVHPALNQAVAWIPGRNDSLLAVFVLAGFIFFIRYLEEKKDSFLLLHFLFFALALFAKENGIMIALLAFFYLQFIFGDKWLSKTKLILGVGYLVIIIPWWIMRLTALDANNKIYTGNVMRNIGTNFPMLPQYIGKTLFPFDLSVLTTLKDTHYIWSILTVALVSAAIYFTPVKRWNYILFGVVWYLLFLFPALVSPFVGLEHRIYVPMFGFLIILSETVWIREIDKQKTFVKVMLLGWIVLLAIISNNRLPLFKNRYSFYKSATETSEHGTFAYLTLGKEYEKIDSFEDAIATYKAGLKIDSTLVQFHNNIGTDYMHLGMYPEAEEQFSRELVHHPKNVTAIYNMGTAYKLEGKMDKAVEEWKKVLAINKDYDAAIQDLANYYISIKDTANYKYYLQMLLKKPLKK
jgi:protein O-mannosyl-transferase